MPELVRELATFGQERRDRRDVAGENLRPLPRIERRFGIGCQPGLHTLASVRENLLLPVQALGDHAVISGTSFLRQPVWVHSKKTLAHPVRPNAVLSAG